MRRGIRYIRIIESCMGKFHRGDLIHGPGRGSVLPEDGEEKGTLQARAFTKASDRALRVRVSVIHSWKSKKKNK